jgi:hypothetical protein
VPLACFETSLQREDFVNHIATLWAMGRDDEANSMAQRIDTDAFSLDGRTELLVIQRLVAGHMPTEMPAQVEPVSWKDLHGELRNPLLLRALSRHDEVGPTRRSLLQEALTAVADKS